MVDETTPLRETVDRSGYAFNMAVAGIIENSGDRQKWKLDAMEIPWSKEQSSGFVDLTITRDRAIGVLECKKVNNGDQLVFLVRQGQTDNEIRCRLDVLRKEIEPTKGILDFHQLRYGTNECTMATGSSESAYCVAPKGNKSANLNLDNIASD